MPGIIALLVFFFVIMMAAGWLDRHPPATQLLVFLGYVGTAVFIYRKFSDSRWLSRYNATMAGERADRAAAKLARQLEAKKRQIAKEWENTDFIIPSVDHFWNEVRDTHKLRAQRALNWNMLWTLTCEQSIIYSHSGLDKRHSVAETIELYNLMVKVCIDGLDDFVEAVPPHLLEDEGSRSWSPFTTERTLSELLNTDHVAGILPFPQIAAPFRDYIDYFCSMGLFAYCELAPPPLPDPPSLRDRIEEAERYSDRTPNALTIKRQWERDKKEHEKATAQRDAMLLPVQLATLGTPYYERAAKLIPADTFKEYFHFPTETRFSGTWIVAPPNRGKTNMLHNLIAQDRNRGTIVLMDSKGELINAYRGLPDVVMIEPRTANINPLQLGSSTRSVEFLEYIFSALLETSMTSLQKTLFRSVLTVLLKVPNATLETFRQILTVGWKPLNLEPYILQTDPATQDFFLAGKKPEFDNATYSETKQQILWRLRLILSNDYLRAIFSSPTTNVPFNQLLDSRKTIIIDNSKDDLGEEGAEFFGRFFVALVWMAAVSRSRLKPQDKVPVFFYIDECHTVIKRDDKIATILDECRSQKIALIMAHQRVAQITSDNVKDALGNCAIRIANSDDDAASLAPRFRVDPGELRLPIGQFACFVRDKTPQAVTVHVPLFDLTTLPAAIPPSPVTTPPDEPRATVSPMLRAKPQLRVVPNDEVEDF
jgi:hypothetical protein